MTKLEFVARTLWEARRAFAAHSFPDLPPLEEWGDGSIPASNGILEEAEAVLKAVEFVYGNPNAPSYPGYEKIGETITIGRRSN